MPPFKYTNKTYGVEGVELNKDQRTRYNALKSLMPEELYYRLYKSYECAEFVMNNSAKLSAQTIISYLHAQREAHDRVYSDASLTAEQKEVERQKASDQVKQAFGIPLRPRPATLACLRFKPTADEFVPLSAAL